MKLISLNNVINAEYVPLSAGPCPRLRKTTNMTRNTRNTRTRLHGIGSKLMDKKTETGNDPDFEMP